MLWQRFLRLCKQMKWCWFGLQFVDIQSEWLTIKSLHTSFPIPPYNPAIINNGRFWLNMFKNNRYKCICMLLYFRQLWKSFCQQWRRYYPHQTFLFLTVIVIIGDNNRDKILTYKFLLLAYTKLQVIKMICSSFKDVFHTKIHSEL